MYDISFKLRESIIKLGDDHQSETNRHLPILYQARVQASIDQRFYDLLTQTRDEIDRDSNKS